MFLKNITINNYRSIQNAELDFSSGLNILIGKNGTGKSNLLRYIYQYVSIHAFLGRRLRNQIIDCQYTICYLDDDDNDIELKISFKTDRTKVNSEIEYTNQITIDKKKNSKILFEGKSISIKPDVGRRKNSEFDEFVKEVEVLRNFSKKYISFEIPSQLFWLNNSNKYEVDHEFFPTSEGYFDTLSIIQTFENSLESDLIAMPHVEDINTEAVLGDVKDVFTSGYKKFQTAFDLDYYLSKLTPIEETRINPNINVYYSENKILVENLLIEFRVNGFWAPWSHLSDGTKRLFYLITECLSQKKGLLLIEEPELGIHPHQLYKLLEFIKEQTEKQIIISTHSPIVLDILDQDELNKITIVKMTDKGTQFFKLEEEQIVIAQEYMNKIGDLSYYWLHSDLENE